MAVLEVRHVKKYFENQKAVDDISFQINQNNIFGLLGPNGAGKTTLLRMITGIFFPDSGEIYLHNKKFIPQQDGIKIGYMPEERGLYKKMKIGEQAIYLAQLKGLSKQKATTNVKKWFEKLEMTSWWNKKVEDLSKGMSQKLQFVTTIVHEPSLIILDEPFSGLDPVNSNLIKDEIFNLSKNGATIIFSTHRMEQVEEICDHIVLVNKGKKILDGSVNEIKQNFKQNIFGLILGSASLPVIHEAPFEVINNHQNEYFIRIKNGFNSNDVLTYIIQHQIIIKSFREILPSINDVFINLVQETPLARQFEYN